MDPSRPPIPFSNPRLIPPHPVLSPKIEPSEDSAPIGTLNKPRQPLPIQIQTPLQNLSPNLDDEYRRFAQFLRSYAEKRSKPSSSSSAFVAAATAAEKKKTRSAEMHRVSFISSDDQLSTRDLVRRTRILYESLRTHSIQEEEKSDLQSFSGKRSRADLNAAKIMGNSNLWLNREKRIIGFIPGIHIGDVFYYRMELCVIGLHGQVQAGIDFVPARESSTGEPIATSIIVSGGYEDDEDHGDVLVYSGHGGREGRNEVKQSVDQKLEGGNLALERSCYHDIEIRVIRGLKTDRSPTGRVYVYDGLYKVVNCWEDVGKSGFSVYKYKLVRLEGQEEMGSVVLKLAEELKANLMSVRPNGYLSLDISKGKEKLPVAVFNDIDDDRDPLLYDYLVRPVFPSLAFQEQGRGGGCQCVVNCSVDCYCVTRNGGEFAYDENGILLRGKPLIYECGKYCKCQLSCLNRVSQKGMRHRLEVFRSRETGWGVRSLDFIRAGEFICEFSGIVRTKQQSEVMSMNGDSLVYPNRFPRRWTEWGDLSSVNPEYRLPEFPLLPELSFSIDVSKARNVACYLSHSRSPNVFVQFVLFDHYNVSCPHLMIFAMENIPPMRDLSLDYGVGDEQGK